MGAHAFKGKFMSKNINNVSWKGELYIQICEKWGVYGTFAPDSCIHQSDTSMLFKKRLFKIYFYWFTILLYSANILLLNSELAELL